MHSLPDLAWLAIALVIALTVLMILYATATCVRNDCFIHDHRVQVQTLRQEYAERALAQARAKAAAMYVDEAPLTPATPAPARKAA